MGRILTVAGRLSDTPYRIRKIERNVYSAEELCYSLAQCADFMDEEIMDPALADWLSECCGMHELARLLRAQLRGRHTPKEFVGTILRECACLPAGESAKVLTRMEEGREMESITKDLSRAQNLAGKGLMRQAQNTYTELLNRLPDMERGTRAQIWKEKGLHYADSFLFERAADCFRMAWELSPVPEHAFWYVASLYMYMDGDSYRSFLEEHPEFYESAYQVEQRAARAESRFKSGSESRQLRRLRQLRRENHEDAFSSRLGHTLKGMQEDYRQRVTASI
ncbi:MAG: hypothetical protein Q4D81_14175 [Eubacteriales bacterium]|nr:hypothetical protein [Eubacteriales bacterium]